jgi:hypothetical protein
VQSRSRYNTSRLSAQVEPIQLVGARDPKDLTCVPYILCIVSKPHRFGVPIVDDPDASVGLATELDRRGMHAGPGNLRVVSAQSLLRDR